MQLHNETKLTAEAMVAADGSLILLSPVILPYRAGQRLLLQATVIEESAAETLPRRVGAVMRYEELVGTMAPGAG